MPDVPSPPSSKSTAAAAPGQPPAPSDITAVLLDVLRNVNREVKTVLALDGKAHDAVVHFQAISASLRTLADGPVAGAVHSHSGTPKGTPPRR
jgi:hypothetical protein